MSQLLRRLVVADDTPTYSAEQKTLIDGDFQAVLVTAPAGSGKTRLLVGRAEALVRKGVPADRICCLTFTQKSAQEMQKRLGESLGQAGEAVVCSTFHGFALDCLKVDSGALNLGEDFQVISMSQSIALLKEQAKEIDPLWVLSDQDAQRIYQNLSRSINKNELMTSDTSFAHRVDSQDIETLYNRFVETKLRLRFVDFDDLMLMFNLLLDSDPNYRERWSERFVHVLVDEYQDVNDLQASMIGQLSSYHGHLFAIGDDAQAIYGFRGANVEHFRQFSARFKNAEIRGLKTNFRSTSTIVNVAELLLTDDEMFGSRTVQSSREVGAPVALVGCASKEAEATFIAAEAHRLIADGLCPSQIAILVRLKSQASVLQNAFQQRKLSLSTKTGRRFADRPHIKQCLALIHLSFEPDNVLVLEQVLSETKGVGAKLVEKLVSALHGPVSPQLTPHQSKLLSSVYTQLITPLSHAEPSAPVLWSLWCAQNHQNAEQDHGALTRDIFRLGSIWPNYQNFEALNNAVALGSSAHSLDAPLEPTVTLMSIHQSKGLEWDTVFVPGLNEGTLPIFGAKDRHNTLSEEKRLLYVACTRARQKLYLSCQASSEHELRQFNGLQSRFLRHAFYRGPHLFNGIWVTE